MAKEVAALVVRILVSLAVLTAAMIGLGLLVKGSPHVWPLTEEDDISRALAAERTSTWDTVTHVFSLIGSTGVIIAMTAAAAVVMRLVFKRWREPLFLIGAVTAQSVVFVITAAVVARSRPDVPHLDDSPPTSSFPSGHTSAALALFGGIALVLTLHARNRRPSAAWWVVLLAVPVAVAVSRLYRGMHHPTDVVASFVNSAVCLMVMARVILARSVAWTRRQLPAGATRAGSQLTGRA
jgi:membrane-associated phospholipid phosphatase